MKEQQQHPVIKKTPHTLVGGGFCFLCVLGSFLLFRFHGEVILNIIKKYGMGFIALPNLMSGVVLVCICVGSGMCFCSLHRLYRENNVLKERCANDLQKCGLKNLKSCYKKLKDSEPKSNNPNAHSLLYRRLEVLHVDENATQTGTERKLPAMQDLHEITLQSELSRLSSSGMTTIISFLLILGILGTLTGVHDVLNPDKEVYSDFVERSSGMELKDLATALTPSALAVLGTVLLMICRAWYLRRLDAYLGYLDAVTLNVILPSLVSEESKKEEDKWGGIVENLNKLNKLNVLDSDRKAVSQEEWEGIESECNKTKQRLEHLEPQLRVGNLPPVPAPPLPPRRVISRFDIKNQLLAGRISAGAELSKQNYNKYLVRK